MSGSEIIRKTNISLHFTSHHFTLLYLPCGLIKINALCLIDLKYKSWAASNVNTPESPAAAANASASNLYLMKNKEV